MQSYYQNILRDKADSTVSFTGTFLLTFITTMMARTVLSLPEPLQVT